MPSHRQVRLRDLVDQSCRHAGGALVHVQARVELGDVDKPQLAGLCQRETDRPDLRQRYAHRRRGAHPRRQGGGEYVEVDAQVDRLAVGDRVQGQVGGLGGRHRRQLVIGGITRAQFRGGLEEEAGVVGHRHPQHRVGEILPELLGGLPERGARGRLRHLPQVQVRIQVHDRRGPLITQCVPQPAMGADAQLVPAAEHHRQVACLDEPGHRPGEPVLRALQVAVVDMHRARVIAVVLIVDGQPAQHLADRIGALDCAGTTVVAAHAFIGGETQQRSARIGGRGLG